MRAGGPFLLRLPPPGPQTQSDCQGPAAALAEPPGAWEQQTAVAHGRPGPGGRDRGAAGAGRPPGHTRPTPHSVLAWREQEPPGTPAFSHRGSDATCQGPHTGTRGPHANARSPTRREAETSAALSIPAAASSQRPRRFISGRPGDLPQAGGARGDAVTKRGVGRAGRPERRVGRGGLVRGARAVWGPRLSVTPLRFSCKSNYFSIKSSLGRKRHFRGSPVCSGVAPPPPERAASPCPFARSSSHRLGSNHIGGRGRRAAAPHGPAAPAPGPPCGLRVTSLHGGAVQEETEARALSALLRPHETLGRWTVLLLRGCLSTAGTPSAPLT